MVRAMKQFMTFPKSLFFYDLTKIHAFAYFRSSSLLFTLSLYRYGVHVAPAASSTPTSLAAIKVEVGEGESIEQALRRFTREVNKSGHLMELRHRRYFETTQQKKKRKAKEARTRARFERMQQRRMKKQMA